MGEAAEMMLDGTLCAGCGEFMDGDGDGIPRYCCEDCAPEGYEFSDDDDDSDTQPEYPPQRYDFQDRISMLQSERDRVMNVAITILGILQKPDPSDFAIEEVVISSLEKLILIRGPHQKNLKTLLDTYTR